MMQNKTAFPKFGNAVLLLGVCGIIKNKDFNTLKKKIMPQFTGRYRYKVLKIMQNIVQK